MWRLIAIGLVAACVGCGSSTGDVLVPKEASEDVVQLRDLLVDSGQPIQKPADISSLSGRYPAAVEGVTSGKLSIVWGKGIREGGSGKAEILAYQSDAESQGGWVIRENATIEKLTAEDFKKEAPKKVAPKK
jgi:hypothetical protein